MSLINQIKADQLQARKDRLGAKASTLTTLLGEAEAIGKNDGNRETTDAEVVAIIKKFIKNIDQCIDAGVSEGSRFFLDVEKDLLSAYLPKELTEQELRDFIEGLIAFDNLSNMGQIMGALKASGESYDGRLASEIIKKELS